jgi:Uma2 family endonuclease
MSLTTSPSLHRRYISAAEWVHDLGDVPLSRIVMDPLPGTATEADQITLVESQRRFVEFVDGTLVEKPMGSFESMIAAIITKAILVFLEAHDLGVVTGESAMMRMSNGRVRMPDGAFTTYDRLPNRRPPRDPIWPVSPDLTIEVLSQSNTKAEIDQKLQEYFASGTRLAWIVDPDRCIVVVYVSSGQPERVLHVGDLLDGGSVLPAFSIPLTTIFKNLINK